MPSRLIVVVWSAWRLAADSLYGYLRTYETHALKYALKRPAWRLVACSPCRRGRYSPRSAAHALPYVAVAGAQAAPQTRSPLAHSCSSGVSICTFVPVSKYFCTNKASEHLMAHAVLTPSPALKGSCSGTRSVSLACFMDMHTCS